MGCLGYAVMAWMWILVVAQFVIDVAATNPYLEALRKRPWKSEQNYVEVRPGAFMFYWLYYADGTDRGAAEKPLIIWIQGGPGLAATGIGNFGEIGPINLNMEPRNHTWVNGKNLLLIDHPVGTGFSYVTDKSLLVSSDRDMATDLARLIKVFYRRHKDFTKTRTYLFGQSYGGKITPRLAFYLHTAIQRKKLTMNLKGIGIGGGWVNPKESSLVSTDFLYNMGIIDQKNYLKSKTVLKHIEHLLDNNDYVNALQAYFLIVEILYTDEGMFNYNNINQESLIPFYQKLDYTVNKYIKPTLPIVNQSIEWRHINEDVWKNLARAFLVPSNKFLEMLLNETKLKVAVYNGNLDAVTTLAGASNWVHKLKWPSAYRFKSADRSQIRGHKNGFYKSVDQLSFWWVFGSGHWVPEDNPTAMQQIMEHILEE